MHEIRVKVIPLKYTQFSMQKMHYNFVLQKHLSQRRCNNDDYNAQRKQLMVDYVVSNCFKVSFGWLQKT